MKRLNSIKISPSSIGNQSLSPEGEGAELQCLPLYSVLLALGNPTVNYFRQPVTRLMRLMSVVLVYSAVFFLFPKKTAMGDIFYILPP